VERINIRFRINRNGFYPQPARGCADPAGDLRSVFRTETRVVATDPGARTKFRRYWSFVSPGIVLIRWLMLGPVKAEAEARARALPHSSVNLRLCRVSGRRVP